MEEIVDEGETSDSLPSDVKDVMETDVKTSSPTSDEMLTSGTSVSGIDITLKPGLDCDNFLDVKKDAEYEGKHPSSTSSTDNNCQTIAAVSSKNDGGGCQQLNDSLPSFPGVPPTTASPFSLRRLPVSPPTNSPLSCDTTGSIKTPNAPPIGGLLTIATPNLLKYGHAKEELVMEEDSVDRCCPGNSVIRVDTDRKDHSSAGLHHHGSESSRIASSFTNVPSPFRPASPAAASSTQLRHRRSVGVSNKPSPRSFSPPILRSATAKTTASDSSGAETRCLSALPTFSPGKLPNVSSGTVMPSSLSPFALQQTRQQQQQQQQRLQPSPHMKAMPRRDLRLDFLGGPIGLKRCNSAPAIDLKLVANIQPSGPFFPTTPTTPTSEASTVDPQTTATTPTTSAINVASSSSFSQNSTSPLLLPSPTRRSSTLFRPIPAMSPSAGGDGSDVVGRRIRRFSSNSVGGGSGGGGRSTSPYPLPRTPSRLEQILSDEFCNPLAREEADEREMNEVQSISSSCDKLDLLGIESSSSTFGSNNLPLHNTNTNSSDDGVSSTSGSQPGRGLGAAFGLDLPCVASTPATPSSSACSSTSRQTSFPTNARSRTNSDPMVVISPGALPASSGLLGLTTTPTLHLSINPNSQGTASAVPNCSPSPTSGCGGLSNIKQRFSPRRQVSYHPASPINRRSLSPLAGHNGIKRKYNPSELSWGCVSQDFEPLNKFPRVSLSRGSTPERGFPTPTASPGLSPKGSSASTQHPAATSAGTSAIVAVSSASSVTESLPSSPSTPQPPSPSMLGNNPFSRSTSPTPPSLAGGSKFSSLPFQDVPPHRRQLSVISNVSSSSAESSFSSLDESSGNAALNFTGFTAVPRSSSSSSSAITLCMTPPSNGSPVPPTQHQQLSHRDSKSSEEILPSRGSFTWPSEESKLKGATKEGMNRVDDDESNQALTVASEDAGAMESMETETS